jgi:hypothetical protein
MGRNMVITAVRMIVDKYGPKARVSQLSSSCQAMVSGRDTRMSGDRGDVVVELFEAQSESELWNLQVERNGTLF